MSNYIGIRTKIIKLTKRGKVTDAVFVEAELICLVSRRFTSPIDNLENKKTNSNLVVQLLEKNITFTTDFIAFYRFL